MSDALSFPAKKLKHRGKGGQKHTALPMVVRFMMRMRIMMVMVMVMVMMMMMMMMIRVMMVMTVMMVLIYADEEK